MKLVINSEGIYLTKVGECFCVKKDRQKQEIAAKKVEQIIITTAAAISTDAIELAVENNIDIVFLSASPLNKLLLMYVFLPVGGVIECVVGHVSIIFSLSKR